MSTQYNSEFAHLAVTHGGPQEVWQNDPFGVGTSVRALEFDRLMACYLGYLAGQPPLPGPLFLLSKPKLICYLHLVLQEVTFNAVGIVSH